MSIDRNASYEEGQRRSLSVAFLAAVCIHLLILVCFPAFESGRLKSTAPTSIAVSIDPQTGQRAPPATPSPRLELAQDIEVPDAVPPPSPPSPSPAPQDEPARARVSEPTIAVMPPTSERRISEPDTQPQPNLDWHEEIRSVLREAAAQDTEAERRRAEMWKSSRSIMFEPPPPEPVVEEEPVLPDLEFNGDQFGGLGFPIGKRCFFGIPPRKSRKKNKDGPPPSTVNLFSCEF